MEHKVEIITMVDGGEWDVPGYGGYCEVYVDGKRVGDGRVGGGCPEDNTRFRDYSWIEPALVALAKALGADVTHRVEGDEG